jgi:hypothetical protein
MCLAKTQRSNALETIEDEPLQVHAPALPEDGGLAPAGLQLATISMGTADEKNRWRSPRVRRSGTAPDGERGCCGGRSQRVPRVRRGCAHPNSVIDADTHNQVLVAPFQGKGLPLAFTFSASLFYER